MRDALLKVETKDIDLATTLSLSDTENILKNAHLPVIKTGKNYGSLATICDGYTVDITKLRQDTESDGRFAKVSYTDDWLIDAQRRDFTMNALYADVDGNLYDPLSQAKADILAGRVRFIGNPHKRIQEDYLRILRFFRFVAWYGKQPIEEATLSACQLYVDKLTLLSKERITHEIFLLMSAPIIAAAIEGILKIGIFSQIFQRPQLFFSLETLKQFLLLENRLRSSSTTHFVTYNPLLRLIALMNFDEIKLFEETIKTALVLKNCEKDYLAGVIRCSQALMKEWIVCKKDKYGNINKYLYFYEKPILFSALMVSWHTQAQTDQANWEKMLAFIESCDAPIFPFRNEELMKKVPELKGVQYGCFCKKIEEWWLSLNCMCTDSDFEEFVEKYRNNL